MRVHAAAAAGRVGNGGEQVVGLIKATGVEPLFIEEPTHPHDVAAHAAIARAIAPTPVAAGESIPNRCVRAAHASRRGCSRGDHSFQL